MSPSSPPDAFTTAVRAYKYGSPTSSLLEALFLHAFWNRLVNVLPTWLPPNVITLMGGGCCLAMYLLDWSVSPAGLGAAQSRWIYLVLGVLFFAYMTFDGLDGKQARRTRTGSALGELMDHGVDAIITGMVAVISADVFGFGLDSGVIWISIFGAQMAFFTSNLTLLHRGAQAFLRIDIIELQSALILMWLLTALLGPEVWRVHFAVPGPIASVCDFVARDLFRVQAPPPPGEVDLRFIPAVAGVTGTVSNFFLYTSKAVAPYFAPTRPAHVLRGEPGTGLPQLTLQVALICVYGGLAFFAQRTFATIPDVATRHDAFRALILAACFAFGDLVNRLLVMRVAHRPLTALPPALPLLGAFALGARLALPSGWWWGVTAASILCHQAYFVWITRKLARALGIAIFRVKPAPP